MKEILESLNLTDTEIQTYLTLLEFGPSKPTKLSTRLNVPRTTLYGVLEKLADIGLVVSSEKNQSKIWQAERPEKISELFDQKKVDLDRQHKNFQERLPLLQALHNTNFNFPRFYYYEGSTGVRQILRDLLLYRNIATAAFWPISDMLEIVGSDFMYEHNAQRIRQNISIRALWPQNRMVDIKKNPYLGVGKNFKREIRIAPKAIDCSMSYWIYGNRIAFISSQLECFGFIIESSEMRQLLLTQFDFFWNISSKLEVDEQLTKEFLKKNRLI